MTTKVKLVNSAYSQLRISGLTVNPTPEDTETALIRLEDMMYQFWGETLDFNYNFEDEPDGNTESGVDRIYNKMIASNLAVELLDDFGKDGTPSLMAKARSSMSSAVASLARERLRKVQYPSRMPIGSGNRRFGGGFHRRYFPASAPPVTSASNERMLCGEIDDFSFNLDGWLAGETIASYDISVGAGLSLVTGIVDPTDPAALIPPDTSLDQNFSTLCGAGIWSCVGALIADNTCFVSGIGATIGVTQAGGYTFSAEKTYTVSVKFLIPSYYNKGQILVGNEILSGEAGNVQINNGDVDITTGIFTTTITGVTGQGFVFNNFNDISENLDALITDLYVNEVAPEPMSDYSTDSAVFYRLKANDCPYAGTACVKITVVTSTGRVNTIERYFEIESEC